MVNVFGSDSTGEEGSLGDLQVLIGDSNKWKVS